MNPKVDGGKSEARPHPGPTAIDLRGFRILDFQGYSAWLAG